MKQCPECKRVLSIIQWEGPILFARGSVVFDDSGLVESTSPAQATLAVEVGKEIENEGIQGICPECGFRAKITEFPNVRRCFLTGEINADERIEIPLIGAFSYSSSAIAPLRIDAGLFAWADTADDLALANAAAEIARLGFRTDRDR